MQKCKKSGTVHYYTYDYILRWPSDIFKYHTFFFSFFSSKRPRSLKPQKQGGVKLPVTAICLVLIKLVGNCLPSVVLTVVYKRKAAIHKTYKIQT